MAAAGCDVNITMLVVVGLKFFSFCFVFFWGIYAIELLEFCREEDLRLTRFQTTLKVVEMIGVLRAGAH